ncbi:hypothetical protein [Auraticoccus monumenti]|uniref:Uncharacterized protein n=1 Tax=Auraticoccus monumenti TaxID=675864 RepID=A0A1G6YIU3_9ACTN|nr:hypothetical protein [Auraticoccus monumenti]SDD89476.1 hypothetical protein SAMN04489747_2001 [Auraticoccus monumenti]
MGALRLHAIAIDEARDIVGADEALSARLREIARATSPLAAGAEPPGLLRRLGPIFRRAPQALVLAPDEPTPDDLEVLLSGHYVTRERALPTWRLLERLVSGLAWGSLVVDLGPAERDTVDFELARAGLSSDVGLGRLLSHDARIGVMAPQGESACARPHSFALAMAEAWGHAVAEDSPPVRESRHRETIRSISFWLDGMAQWGRVAAQQGRPVPDLVAFAVR